MGTPEFHDDPARLHRLAYRAAARIAKNRLIAEEAGERAVHRYQLAALAGRLPDSPEAWISTVARRNACAILRNGWSRMQPIYEADEVADPGPAHSSKWSGDRLRCVLRSVLTARQREALDAALSCRSTREAARACGMAPRDFRRYLEAISVRARTRLRGFALARVGSEGASE